MGTTSSALASSSSSSSSSAAATFNGSSTYAADLQNAITRAVGFATLPLTQLQNQQNDLNTRQTALTSLSTQFQGLQTALDSINTASSTESNAVTLSSNSVATATVTAAADDANYALTVTNIGATTNALSSSGLTTVSNPDSADITNTKSLTLTVDGKDFTIDNSANTLTGLKNAINGSGANVNATIINIGSSTTPDYRLSVQGGKYAPTTISLSDGTKPLLTTQSTGANVQYAINGQSSSISSDTRTLALAPGLTVNLTQSGTTTISVARSATNISTALSAFATAYNSAFDELAKSRGTTASALSGDSIIYSAQSSLENLRSPGNTGTATVNSLEDLGFSFGKDGHLTYDPSVLAGASSATLSDAAKFLGSETSGGFLQAANNTLDGLDNAATGLFFSSSQAITAQLTSLGTKITDTQTRITSLQTSLTAQMDAADAAIASLQQTASYFTSLFSTVNANSYGNVNG